MNLIAVMPLEEAKSLQRQMLTKNIEIMLNHAKETCNRGCSITVEVHANEQDIPLIAQTLNENFTQMLDNPDFDLSNLNNVFNPEADEAICPACGFKFSTSLSECPDCGLAFG